MQGVPSKTEQISPVYQKRNKVKRKSKLYEGDLHCFGEIPFRLFMSVHVIKTTPSHFAEKYDIKCKRGNIYIG